MLQWLGTSPQPWQINSEVGGFEDAVPCDPLWTFLRYDAPLEAYWVALHLKDPPAAALLPRLGRLDDDTQAPALYDLGLRVGEVLVKPEHFPAKSTPPRSANRRAPSPTTRQPARLNARRRLPYNRRLMDTNPISAPTNEAQDRLPLVVTVGFTGHREVDDMAAAERLIGEALAAIGEAFATLRRSPHMEAFDGAPRMRLIAGDAPGTDRAVAAVWRATGLGQVHPIFPFREAATGAAYTDLPGVGGEETRVEAAAQSGDWTGLDCVSLGLERNQGHAEVGRLIVRHADLLLSWWNGAPPPGPGGAGDTLRRALERGLPVIWLKPGEAHPRLVDPARLRQHADAAEAMVELATIAEPLSSDRLAELLAGVLVPPTTSGGGSPRSEAAARLDYVAVDPLKRRPPPLGVLQAVLDHTLWRFFRSFELIAGGMRPPSDPDAPTPSGLAAQPGFRRLQSATDEAIARANHLSSIHRSEQLLLIVIAIAAVFVGALPALVGAGKALATSHALAAEVEFALGVTAFFLAAAAGRQHRHRRWSDARRLAERLRAATATWPLGFDIADAHAQPPPSWTEWRARAVIRAAGLPLGWIDRPRLNTEAAWISRQLIGGQIDYHARQHRIAENIERFVRRVESAAFAVLMLTLLTYLIMNWTQPLTGWSPPHWVGGFVTLVSAVSPAVGAGCLALEATNGFGELALHSERLEDEFEDMRARLGHIDKGSYHHIQQVVRRAAQLVVEDADAWRDRVLRRRIVRGG